MPVKNIAMKLPTEIDKQQDMSKFEWPSNPSVKIPRFLYGQEAVKHYEVYIKANFYNFILLYYINFIIAFIYVGEVKLHPFFWITLQKIY